jgi:predicted alpha/beta superfamily hydrolase
MIRTVLFALLICTQCLHAQHRGQVVLGVADTMHSAILNENRVLNIYLPEGYNPDSATLYPVIYLLDGGVDEDFIHVAGLVRFNTTAWVSRVPRCIIVGIANANRTRDFTFSTPNLDFLKAMGFDKSNFGAHGGSAKFIAFIEKELQPYIQAHYKTNGSKTIIGESLGGLLATEILLRHPALFNTYIIITPSLWWGNQSLLSHANLLTARAKDTGIQVYIGAADKNENAVMYNDAERLAQLLKKYEPRVQSHFDYLPNETHATIMHQALYNAFRLVYGR